MPNIKISTIWNLQRAVLIECVLNWRSLFHDTSLAITNAHDIDPGYQVGNVDR